jgi:tetratricopeptide (TPR) repeat protein
MPDIPLARDLKSITYVHVIRSFTGDSVHIMPGDLIGKVAPYPDTLSRQFDNEINLSKDYYKNQNFLAAKSILETAVNKDSSNLFVLENYARASYQCDKDRSFEIYKKLVSNLDSIYRNRTDSIKIDLWFREAYWKLGTLYMDHKMWKEAYFEISIFIMGIQDAKGSRVYCQALQFLTECAYMLYEDKLASYIAQRTLMCDPANEYAKSIIRKLN